MNHPRSNIDHVEKFVVDRYQRCITSFTPEHLIDLMHSIITYHRSTSTIYQASIQHALPASSSAQFWRQGTLLANAIQPVIHFCRSRNLQRASLRNTLLPVTFLIMEGTSSVSSTRDTESAFLQRVRETLDRIKSDWDSLLTESSDSLVADFGVTVTAYPRIVTLSPGSKRDYFRCLCKCMERINYLLDSSAMYSCGESQKPFYADLRNAFRSRFYETRDLYGLSSLDRLNLSVRVNLFLSHYSRITWSNHLATPDLKEMPFYPCMALVQSSGSGKSRLLRELGRALPLAYANLGAEESKGYPLTNKSLRRFLLFESPLLTNVSEVDSQCCEDSYRCLLLTTTIVFYLLFSDRDDDKKRITLPSMDTLEKKKIDTGWTTVGICEPDRDGTSPPNDLFWEIVTLVTRQLLIPNRKISESARTSARGSLLLTTDSVTSEMKYASLVDLEKSLRVMGTSVHSPETRATGCSEPWSSSQRTESQAQRFNNTVNCILDPGNIATLILEYLQLRIVNKKETLSEIAKTLQQVQKDEGSNKEVLYALFVALDESRCLTQHMVQDRRTVTQSESRQDATVSAFRCLRRVAHRMFDTTGVFIFLLFSDTTAKLANFTPQRALDPSARMLPEELEEVPGQVYGPFTELSTESVGVLLPDKTIFNFRERLVAFCRRWGSPALSSDIECVSEQVTSLPFDVLKERGEVPSVDGSALNPATLCADTILAEDSGPKARSGNLSAETIFRKNDDYVYLGRPLWVSSMIHNDKGATWRDMVVFAMKKLLGGKQRLLKDTLPVYTKQCLAVIACRVPLQFVEGCGIAPQLIAEHMAWCQAVSWDREAVYLQYINEPLLATAAAVLWEQELDGMLRCLAARCGSYLSNKGDLGEIAACILLVHGLDRAFRNQDDVIEPDRGISIPGQENLRIAREESQDDSCPAKNNADTLRVLPRGLSMHGTVSLKKMLESSFCLTVVDDYSLGLLVRIKEDRDSGDGGQAWMSRTSALSESSLDSVIFVPRILAEAEVRFKSIKRGFDSIGCRDIPFLFEANVAVLTKRNQIGVDILIPLRLQVTREDKKPETAWSCVTVQVKNRQRCPRAATVAGKHLDPIQTGAVNCDKGKEGPCERCILMQKHHFGIVLNVHKGVVPSSERSFGRMWTFLDQHVATEGNNRTGSSNSSRSSKRRKRFTGHWDEETADDFNIPRRACLMINGIFNSSPLDHATHLNPEILRQLENLVAQGTFSGMIKRTRKQRTDSVNKVAEQATKDDEANYHMLEKSCGRFNHLSKWEEQRYSRKAP